MPPRRRQTPRSVVVTRPDGSKVRIFSSNADFGSPSSNRLTAAGRANAAANGGNVPPRARRARAASADATRTRAQRARDFSSQNARGRAAGQRVQDSFRSSVQGEFRRRATVQTRAATGQGPARVPRSRTTGAPVSASRAAAQRSRASELFGSTSGYNQGQAARRAQRVVSTGTMPDGSRASRRQRQLANTLIKNSRDTR